MGINMSNEFFGFLVFCIIMAMLTALCLAFSKILSEISDKLLTDDEQ